MLGFRVAGRSKIWAQSGDDAPAMTAAPVAAVKPVTEEFFGTKVTDPYRWLEELKDPDVQKWFKGQDDYTRGILAKIPGRAALLKRIAEVDQSAPYRVFDVQRLAGEKYFYQKRMANDDVAKLYVREGLDGKERLLVDPNQYVKEAGTHYSFDYYAPSLDGQYVAYGVSPSGSEDAAIHVMNVTTGKETGESISRSWYGGIGWLPDNKSFVHIRFQELKPGMDPAERRLKSRVWLHHVGMDAEKDLPVFGWEVDPKIKLDPADASFVGIDPRSPHALACVNHGFDNNMTCYTAPVEAVGQGNASWTKLFDSKDEVTNLDLRGEDLYLISHNHAPRSKVLHTTFSRPDLYHAEVVLASSEMVVSNMLASPDALYVVRLDGGLGRLTRIPYGGGAAENVALPVNGSASLGGGDPRLPGLLMYLQSWTRAYNIYRYDPGTKQVGVVPLQTPGMNDAPADLESEEAKVASWDGTMVPLSIVHKKGIKLDGSHPTLLEGYGAYAISEDPYFDPKSLAWFEHDGILAFAHVRGGGEYGEEWHEAAMKNNKPNTWKDFIACAEYLQKHGYSSPRRLAGQAGSAGGILIGRAFTSRPDLFAAALDDVGLSDMIRDMVTPDGPLNVPEYGGLDTAEGFRNLREISAYYHVKDGERYPAVLLTTGWNDPRVVPWEPGKMAARLQAATGSGKPVLLRVDYQGGHGGFGATRSQREELAADQWSFLLWQFGAEGFQPGN
jgi:prolyl oligopeptidase